jgi:HK97 family phage major capsid protein
MSDPLATEALRRIGNIASTVSGAARRERLAGYSLRRVIDNLAHEQRRGFFEAEISQDLERTHPASRGGIIVPWEVFVRADTVANLTQGGYLVEALNLDAADALRPTMAVGALGATIIPAPMGANVNLPRLTGVSTASWLTTESTGPIAETNQTFGQVAFSPSTVGAYTELSRLILLQAGPSPAEFVVRRDLVNVVARALDYAALFGSGTNGQPKGLATYAGVSTFSGTTMSLTSIVNAAVALGDALDDSAGVAANRTTAGLLKTRQEASGSTRLLWEGSLVAGSSVGFPARSSSAYTAGSYFLGSWRYLNVVVWGDGIEITANPYGDQASGAGNFQKGIVGVRAFLTADAQPTFAAAFNYASAVT